MSQIIACFKWIADETTLAAAPDGSLDRSRAQGMLSSYDRQTIEAAVQAAKALEAKAVGLTYGGEDARPSLKEALSRGLDECVFVKDENAAAADGCATAKVLAAVVRAQGDVSLVLCTDGAGDTLNRQTAPRLAALLDWPLVTAADSLQISDGKLSAARRRADCVETVEVPLPAVVSVTSEVNVPPLPGLKAIMAAKKKPVSETAIAELHVDAAPKAKLVSEKLYVMDRKHRVFGDGEAAEKADLLYESLKKEGVL